MRGPEILAAGFTALNLLTPDRNAGITDRSRRIPAARVVSRRRVLQWFPELPPDGLTGAGVFWDGQMQNPPRLVWAMVRSAARAGAIIANHCEVTTLLQQGGRVIGATVQDRIGRERLDVRARVVVNAAGPYAEALLLRSGVRKAPSIPYSRDMALVLKRTIVHDRALAVQTKYHDPSAVLSRGTRHLFLVPWRGRTMVGVNSLIWKEEPDRLRVTEKEVTDFLDEINEADPRLQLTLDDVGLVMAGLLPVERGDAEGGDVSFGKRPLVVDNAAADGVQGLVTAVANRYTVARGVAQRSVDLAYRKLGREPRPCRTETARVYGGDFGRFEDLVREVRSALPAGTDPRVVDRLAHDHGSAYGEVTRIVDERPDWGRPVAGTDVLRAEVVHSARNEMVAKLGDCVFGRLGIGTLGDPGPGVIEEVAALCAEQLGWDPARRDAEVGEVRARFPFRRAG